MNDRTSQAKRAYRANWIIGAGDPVRDGVIALDGECIMFAGPQTTFDNSAKIEIQNLADSVIFPGLINCHTHTNAPRDIRPEFKSGSMTDWARASVEIRSTRSESDQLSDIQNSLDRLKETATVAIGEISNDFVSLKPIIDSGLICRYFCERFGFQSSRALKIIAELESSIGAQKASLSVSLADNSHVTLHKAPHAPYSTSPELIRALADKKSLCSIHLAENREECELLQTGGGPWRDYLRKLEKDDPDWIAPGRSPAEYLESLGALNENMLLIHLTQVTSSDIKLIEKHKSRAALCPRSNTFIGVGTAPLDLLVKSDIPLGIGTDSYSSNDDLNVFAEMRELRRLYQSVPANEIWELATIGGAKALGVEDRLGELIVGLSPGVFAAEIPGALDIDSPAELLERLIAKGDQNLTQLSRAKI